MDGLPHANRPPWDPEVVTIHMIVALTVKQDGDVRRRKRRMGHISIRRANKRSEIRSNHIKNITKYTMTSVLSVIAAISRLQPYRTFAAPIKSLR